MIPWKMSGNNNNLIPYIYSSRQWFSLSAIIFTIVIIGSAFIIRRRAAETVNNDTKENFKKYAKIPSPMAKGLKYYDYIRASNQNR